MYYSKRASIFIYIQSYIWKYSLTLFPICWICIHLYYVYAPLFFYYILFYSILFHMRRGIVRCFTLRTFYICIYSNVCHVASRGGVQRDSLKWSQIFASTINVYIHTEEWLQRCVRVWWNLCVYILFSLTFQPPFKDAHFASLTRIATKMWCYHWLYVVGYISSTTVYNIAAQTSDLKLSYL